MVDPNEPGRPGQRAQGVWPAMLTPFREGNVALDVVEQLVELFVQQGLGGLYILGSTGQWPLLSRAEREQVAERVVATAAGRIPVIVHVGAVATGDAVELARHAERIGADGISAVAPIYYPTSVDQVFEHYRRIGQATSLPLYVYHLSIVNQVKLDAREYARRVLELPGIAGMKITDHDLYQFGLLASVAGDRLTLFSGADELLCQAAVSGAVGAIGTFFNLWGVEAQAARAAFVAGDFRAGQAFMTRLQTALAEVLASGSIWTFLRAAMQRRHKLDVGLPRQPLGSLDRPWAPERLEPLLRLDDCNGQ